MKKPFYSKGITMHSLTNHLTLLMEKAFVACGYEGKWGQVKISDRPDLGDYQCNGALGAAKQAQKNPRNVAEEILSFLTTHLPFAHCSLAGPGFINVKLDDQSLMTFAQLLGKEEKCGVGLPKVKQKIFVDYGGPNAAKPMHVGHLRSSIIGESIKRLLRFIGHEVIGDIHLGDWGTQMGMLIHAISEREPSLIYFKENYSGPYPQESPVSLKDLEDLYPQISGRCKDDVDLAEKCRKATVELQQGRPGYRALWHHFVDVSVQDMKQQFDLLGVSFEQWFGESRYQDQLAPMIEELLNKEIAVPSEGAVVISVAKEEDKTEMPPLLLRKSDGGFLYATTDLATLKERVQHFKADRVIYVVDGRQSLHFDQVFRAAHKAGYHVDTKFLGFGTMNGPDNKPFKTRTGGVMKLSELIGTLIQEAKMRIEEAGLGLKFSEDEKQDIAYKVGIATLKFADLQHDPQQNYIFDISKFMKFEGKTGPYLLYAAVRIKSLLRKAQEEGLVAEDLTEPLRAEERELLLMLLRFPDVIERAATQLAPNALCEFAFELAQKFSRFYQACPVLSEPDSQRKKGRLTLCSFTLKELLILLDLLGIPAPERM
jgi:arginyl-tRNA synthetase